jgi:ADP-ribose pyrophosphatase YjhB (NUDIX family)
MPTIDETWYIRPENVLESISSGGIVVRLEAGQARIALVRESQFSVYILPKGRVEAGESNEAAARREIEEEAGLSDLSLIDYLGARQRLNFTRNRWITIHYYLFQTRQSKPSPTDPNHSYICEWFLPESLPDFFWPEQNELVLDSLPRIQALLDECDSK